MNLLKQYKIIFVGVVILFVGTIINFFMTGSEATAVSFLMMMLSFLNVVLFGAVLKLNYDKAQIK